MFDRLATHLAEGSVAPAVDRVVTLGEAPEPLADLEAGTVRGKLAVRISEVAR